MKRIYLLLMLVSLLGVVEGFKGEQPSLLGNKVADFKLKGTDNKIFHLNTNKNAKGYIVIFTCDHCPFAKLYTARLNAMNTKYKALGVPLIAINSMDTLVYEEENFLKMQKRATDEHFNFPYLQDQFQTVAKDFKANRTPEAYVIWKENNEWVIKYDGAIDDNGQEPSKATPFVNNAVDELLSGKKVSHPENASIGCTIYFRKEPPVKN